MPRGHDPCRVHGESIGRSGGSLTGVRCAVAIVSTCRRLPVPARGHHGRFLHESILVHTSGHTVMHSDPEGGRMQPRRISVVVAAAFGVVALVLAATPAAAQGDTMVSVGSPPSPFAQNKQNEPSVAIDASNPMVVAAGANDNIDLEACNAGDPTT